MYIYIYMSIIMLTNFLQGLIAVDAVDDVKIFIFALSGVGFCAMFRAGRPVVAFFAGSPNSCARWVWVVMVSLFGGIAWYTLIVFLSNEMDRNLCYNLSYWLFNCSTWLFLLLFLHI